VQGLLGAQRVHEQRLSAQRHVWRRHQCRVCRPGRYRDDGLHAHRSVRLIDDALLTNKPHIKLTGALVEPVVVNGISRTFLADPDTR